MALKATVCRLELAVSDLERGHYADYRLTVARHPSETDARMMLRILAFALHADEALQFTRGISNTDEPDLWLHAPDGSLELWIELGQPDPRRLRQACGRARRVEVLSYGDRAGSAWWAQVGDELRPLERLTVRHVDTEATEALAALAARQMSLQVTIDDGCAWVSNDTTSVAVTPERWLR